MNKQIWIADGDKNRLSIYKKILSQHPDKTFNVKTFQSVQKCLKSFSFAESIPLCIFDDDTAFSEAVNTIRSLQSVSSGTALLLLFSDDQVKSSEPHRLLQDNVYHLKKPVSDDVLHSFADSLIASWNIRRTASEQRRQCISFLNDAEIGIWEWHLASDKWRVNDCWFKMIGCIPGAFPVDSETWKSLMHPDDLHRTLTAFQHLIDGKTDRYELELRLKHDTEKWRWFLSRGHIIERDEQGNAVRLAGIHIDINERKNAERKLLEVREQFSTAFEFSPLPMWIAEPSQGRFFRINNAFRNKTGFKREDILGNAVKDFFIFPGTDNFQMREIGHLKEESVLLCRKNGSYLEGVASDTSVLFNGKQYRMGVFTDSSRIKELEMELSEAQAFTKCHHQTKKRFLTDIRNGIRQPVSSISGMIDLIQGSDLTFEQSVYAEKIRENTENLAAVLNNIGDVLDIESCREEFKTINFDLRCMVEDIKRLISTQSDLKLFTFTCKVERNVPSLLRGDPARLRQSLLILLNNAIRFTEQGNISLRVVCQKETVDSIVLAFSVRDTGVGIPLKQIEYINDAQPNNNVLPDEKQDISFRLPIVQHLCHKMGGKLSVASQVGQGTEFCITAVFQKQRDVVEPLQIDSLLDRRVLIVNDSFAERSALQKQISAWGCLTDEAEDGDGALKKMHQAFQQSRPFNLIIIDLELPDMAGIILGKEIKSSPLFNQVGLIMMTSVGRRGDANKCRNAGFSAYLVTPFNPDLLKDCLGIVLHRTGLQNPDTPDDIITRHTLLENRKRIFRIFFISDFIHSQKYMECFNNMGYQLQISHKSADIEKKLKKERYDIIFLDGFSAISREKSVLIFLNEYLSSASIPMAVMGGDTAVQESIRNLIPRVLTVPAEALSVEQTLQSFLTPLPKKDAEIQENNVCNETDFPPVDIAFAIESFDGDAALLKHYIDNFVIDSDLMLSEIQDAIDLRQLETIRKMLSTYKGKLEFLADKQSLKIINRIEKAAKSNDFKKIEHLFLKLVDSYLCIKNYLNGVEFETLT